MTYKEDRTQITTQEQHLIHHEEHVTSKL